MVSQLYDVYLTGKLADGVSPALAAQRLAALFKSTPEAMAALVTGKAQLVKRGLDQNTALKYRDALRRAGCEAACREQLTAATSTQTAPTPDTAPLPAWQLAPAGDDLLRADGRRAVTPVVIDTTQLSIAPLGPLPSLAAKPAAVPDTSYLSLAPAGSDVLTAKERKRAQPAPLDTDHLTLAP